MRKLLPLIGLLLTFSLVNLQAQEAEVSPAGEEKEAEANPVEEEKEVKASPAKEEKKVTFGEAPDKWIDQQVGPYLDEVTGKVFYGVEVAKDDKGEPVKLPLVVVWLGLAAVIITIYFKFLNLRSWKLAAKTIAGKYSSKSDPGEITHFQALCAALSGTVGLGNIAGVAIAIGAGGPGATFWMILIGLFGMTSKFCECTLGVKYRTIENGKVYGGPMQYLKKGFAEKNMGMLGVILAGVFAFLCIGGSFGGGNMVQANQACDQLVGVLGEDSFFAKNRWAFGVILGVTVGLVIIGGIKSIASVTAALVPFMCGIYMLAGIFVIAVNISEVGTAFSVIFKGAFSPEAIGGGVIGVMIQGMKRATFSNEAGIGSAPIAHSAAKTKFAASEGIVALLEPFIDTVVVCTTTALVIIMSGTYDTPGLEGVAVTSAAFESVISWFPLILTVAVILFAFSTMISWSYYGVQAWTHLFGRSAVAELIYKVIFCLFVILGSSLAMSKVFDFSDAMIFAMSVPNVIAMYLLMPRVKEEYVRYIEHTESTDAS
ncbi:MAG: alanine/glycine:cation symporter family protein [Akkermansiaceae bacterium]|jgi:AGCS family alanine or glycine:cation symporter